MRAGQEKEEQEGKTGGTREQEGRETKELYNDIGELRNREMGSQKQGERKYH